MQSLGLVCQFYRNSALWPPPTPFLTMLALIYRSLQWPTERRAEQNQDQVTFAARRRRTAARSKGWAVDANISAISRLHQK